MALITCTACGKPVSDKALKCPHCGIVLREPEEKTAPVMPVQPASPAEPVNPVPPAPPMGKDNTPVAMDGTTAIVSFLGAVAALVPLFYNVYDLFTRHIPPLIDAQPTPQFLTAMGIAIVGGVLSLAAFVYAIVRISKKAKAAWGFWMSAIAVAAVASFGTFYAAYNAVKAYDVMYNEKAEAVRGTYSWVSKQDSTTTVFSMVYGGYVEYHGKEGSVTEIIYDYKHDRFGVVINVDGEETLGWYDADMKYVETASGRVPVTKISSATYTKEEGHTRKAEADKQSALEEFKRFRTFDLSALMLHGKVKKVEESYGGNACTVYHFNEQGKLINVVGSGDNYKSKITRESNKLNIIFENPNDQFGYYVETYTLDGSGRVISNVAGSEDYGEKFTYSAFDNIGWPSLSSCDIEEIGEESTVKVYHLTYPSLDEYDNWTIQTSRDESGYEVSTYRTIEYYK